MESIQGEYNEALRAFLTGAHDAEQPLIEAAALGRRALSSGVGVLELIMIHHRALAELAGSGSTGQLAPQQLEAAARFLSETMSTYEMAHKRFREVAGLMNRIVEFGNVLCHELRTPLTSILLSTSSLKDVLSPQAHTPEAKLLENVISSGTILKARTDDLADIVGLQSGTLSLNVITFDLRELLKNTCQRLEREVSQAGIRLNLDVPEELLYIRGDAGRIEQVIANLVHNAVKYGADGGRIDVRARRTNGTAVLEVQDYGQGMSIWGRMRLLVPAYRVQRGEQTPPGLGVALTLCHQVVEAHRGTISAESETGKGTCFRVVLPLLGGLQEGAKQ